MHMQLTGGWGGAAIVLGWPWPPVAPPWGHHWKGARFVYKSGPKMVQSVVVFRRNVQSFNQILALVFTF